jgi:hypothetical protein
MLRNLSPSVLALLIAASSCARHTIPSVTLTPQTRIGPAEDYGLSIADVTARDIDFNLEQPAYVIALRVTDGGMIGLVAPLGGTPKAKRGAHYLRARDVRDNDVTWVERSYWTPAFSTALPCTGPADQRATLGFAGCTDAYTAVPLVEHSIRLPVYGAAADGGGYWVLIASDAPMHAAEIRQRLDGVARSNSSLVSFVRSLPEQLLASRANRWVASYAPFGDSTAP